MNRRLAVSVALLALAAAIWFLRPHDAVAPGAEGGRPTRAADPSAPDAIPAARSGPGLAPTPVAGPARAGAESARGDGVSAKGSFAGVVVKPDGTPCAGATVVAIRLAGRVGRGVRADLPPARTGADGRFAFDPSGEPEQVGVLVSAPGFAPANAEAWVKRGVEARLLLVPGCEVRIVATDAETGRPVAGVEMRAVTGEMVDALFTEPLDAPAIAVGTTGPDGRVALWVGGGRTTLYALPKEHAPAVLGGLNVPKDGIDVPVRLGVAGSIEVRVVDPAGVPVAGAGVLVKAQPLYSRSLTTGPAGTVRFEGVPPTGSAKTNEYAPSCALAVEAKGFPAEFAEAELPDAKAVREVEVRLVRGTTLEGKVVRADGSAAPGVRVVLEPQNTALAFATAPGTLEAVSDARGEFALEPVAPGRYGIGAPDSEGGVRYQQVEVPEVGAAAPVEIRLPDEKKAALHVRVEDAAGAPVAGVLVEAYATGSVTRSVGVVPTDAAGKSAPLDVPAGPTTVIVHAPSGGMTAVEVDFSKGAPEEIVLRLPGGEISGRLLHLDGSPARTKLRLSALGILRGCMLDSKGWCEPDEAGRFHFRSVGEGGVEIGVDREGAEVLIGFDAWAKAGDRDLTLWVATPAEAATLHVEFILVDAATGKPVPAEPGWSVTLSRSGAKDLHPSDGWERNDEGRFLSHEPVPPGTYDVEASFAGWRAVRLFGVRYPRTGPVPTLRLERGGGIEGTVKDAAGKAIEGVTVTAGRQSAKTGADGAYALTGCDEGTVEVKASSETVKTASIQIVVPAAGSARGEFVLERRGAIRLKLPEATPIKKGLSIRAEREGLKDVRTENPSGLEIGNLRWKEERGFYSWVVPALEAGTWRVSVAWDGKALPPLEAVVVEGETTLLDVPPR